MEDAADASDSGVHAKLKLLRARHLALIQVDAIASKPIDLRSKIADVSGEREDSNFRLLHRCGNEVWVRHAEHRCGHGERRRPDGGERRIC